MTNEEYIKSMSTEALATYLSYVSCSDHCDKYDSDCVRTCPYHFGYDVFFKLAYRGAKI